MDPITQAVKAIAVLTNFIATLADPREAAKRVGPASIELHNNVQLPELLFGWLDQLEELNNLLKDLAGENDRINEERLQDLKVQVLETIQMTEQYPGRHPHWWIKDLCQWQINDNSGKLLASGRYSKALDALEGWGYLDHTGALALALVRRKLGGRRQDQKRTSRVPKSKK